MTTFQNLLKRYKNSIDRQLDFHLGVLIASAKKNDPQMVSALEQVRKIALSGGKRIRGILLIQAYLGAGGREKKKILKVAGAIELLHLFFLIHDDIIDHGSLRHGQKTVHEYFAKKIKKADVSIAEHFGNSVAIIIGDLLHAHANEIILKAGFGESETLETLCRLQSIVATTIIGQSQDIAIENSNEANEKEVLAMYENKTAKYTFEGPLQIGAILAGLKDKKTLKILNEYAIPVGIAFQIQDYILGVFGAK